MSVRDYTYSILRGNHDAEAATVGPLEIDNLFDESAQVGGDTTILTSRQRSCVQVAAPQRCATFNPMTEVPVEGVHYAKGARFGQARNPTNFSVGGDYQLPRTFLLSVGLRF